MVFSLFCLEIFVFVKQSMFMLKTLILSLFLFTSCLSSSPIRDDLKVMGWLEFVRLFDDEVVVKVKLDPGAKTSSMHAKNIKRFKKGDVRWVRFDFIDADQRTGEKIKKTIERPLVRNVLIKAHKAKSRRRPVVTMPFNLGGKIYETEFSLTDRSRFHYPVLLGRRFLKDVTLVDSGKTYLLGEIESYQ